MFFKPLNILITSTGLIFLMAACSNSQPNSGNSFYKLKLIDAKAVYLTPDNFPVHGDGVGDDSDALQQAIDEVEKNGKFGIVFVPEGTYRITKTIHIWKGIRLIGYGQKRPVLLLPENTPGYSEGAAKYMMHFTSWKPAEGEPIEDANPGTFYSAISNIDFEIKDGNKDAIAIRSHVAQHCFLAHINFYIGTGKAAVDKVGNEIDDCQFFGGDFGIITTKPSPSWPFLLIDSYFEGQRIAAIETEEAGLTIIRNRFKNVPSAITVRSNRAEELFMEDCRFENIGKQAIVISDEYNARSQFNIKNSVCIDVPVFASFRKSGKIIRGNGLVYKVVNFIHGNQIKALDDIPKIETSTNIETLDAIPDLPISDIPVLPAQDSWVNIVDLGAVGDGTTDNTKIILEAVEQHKTIYFPSGRYRVTETIKLKPNTVLVGLSPITTQLLLLDSTSGFHGLGTPKPLLETRVGGTNIVTGMGLDTGGINSRAVAAKWMAGENSMMNDVKFLGGHGTYDTNGNYLKIYNNNRTADGDRNREWDSQYWSLWITNEGGGIFKNIWTASPFAQAAIYVSNTSTKGRIYAMSLEHHVRNEAIFRNVSNWKVYAFQMEEERGEGWNALPLEIENCSHICFANLYLYRSRMLSPYPNGVVVKNSNDLEFCGVHVYSATRYSFDNTIYDAAHDIEIRSREIANLKISDSIPLHLNAKKESPVLAPHATVEKVADGFEFIIAATADTEGNIFFIDGRWHTVYCWSVAKEELSNVFDLPISPVGLAFDKSGNLLVTTTKNEVISFDPDKPREEFTVIKAEAAIKRPDGTAMLPGHLWRDEHDYIQASTQQSESHFVSLDGSTYVPYFEDIRRAYSLRPAIPGQPFFMADEFGQKTYSFDVAENGRLYNPVLFAEEGEFDVAVDVEGHVYVAAGDIFVYDKTGKQIDIIKVPERPSTMVFGGKDKKTLFITARSSLYSVKTKFSGR